MPKMKTRRAAAKRFKVTATGKVKKAGCGLRHKLEHKSRKVKKTAAKGGLVDRTEVEKVKRMLPYAF